MLFCPFCVLILFYKNYWIQTIKNRILLGLERFYFNFVNSRNKSLFTCFDSQMLETVLILLKPYLMKNYFTFFLLLFTFFIGKANIVINNGLTHSYDSKPGSTIKGTIEVQNIGESERRIIIYKEDLLRGCDGKELKVDSLSHDRSSISWMTLGEFEKVLEPNEKFIIPYEMVVPSDNSLNGSYWNMILVEMAEAIDKNKDHRGISVSTKMRYGIQVITDIKTTDESVSKVSGEEIQFSNFNKYKEGDINVIQVQLMNQSIFRVNVNLVVDMMNADGETVKTIELNPKKIYPNSCSTFDLYMEGVEPGTYDAVIVADYGSDLFGINVEVNLE